MICDNISDLVDCAMLFGASLTHRSKHGYSIRITRCQRFVPRLMWVVAQLERFSPEIFRFQFLAFNENCLSVTAFNKPQRILAPYRKRWYDANGKIVPPSDLIITPVHLTWLLLGRVNMSQKNLIVPGNTDLIRAGYPQLMKDGHAHIDNLAAAEWLTGRVPPGIWSFDNAKETPTA